MTKVQSQTMYKRKENSTCLSLLFFLHSNKQVLYVSFSDMSCDMVQTSQMVHSSLEIKTIQVDNQLPSAVYPVALFVEQLLRHRHHLKVERSRAASGKSRTEDSTIDREQHFY